MKKASPSEKANYALPEADELVQALFEQTTEGIFITDHVGKILEVNQRGCQMLGYTRDNLMKHWLYELFPPESQQRQQFPLQTNSAIEKLNGETSLLRSDGQSFWAVLRVQNLPKGALLCTLRDISARKQAEQDYHNIFDNAVEGVFQSSPEGYYIRVNPAMARLYGYKSPEEMLKSVTDIAHQIHTNSRQRERFVRNLHKNGIVENFVGENYRKDGSAIWTLTNARIVRGRDGKVVCYEGFVQDITQRHQAEIELRKAKEQLQLSVEGSGIGLWDWYIHTGETTFNERWAAIIGYTLKELEPVDINTWIKFCHPEDLEKSNQLLQRHFRGETEEYECEVRMRHKSGRWVWVLDRGRVVEWDPHRKPLRISGTHLDITERKQIEEVVRAERDKAQQYLDIAGVIIVALDANGRVTLINQRGCQILGYPESEIQGQNWFDKFIPATLRKQVKTVFRSLMGGNTGDSEYNENHILTRSGEEKIIAWHNTVLRDSSGKITGTLSSGEDITERKRAGDALRESEAQYRSLFENAPVGIAVSDLQGNILMHNAAVLQPGGYTDEDTRKTVNISEVRYDPNKDKELLHLFQGQGSIHKYPLELKRKDGSPYSVLLSLAPVTIKGQPCIQAIVEDVTERKWIEAQINLLSKAVEQTADGIMIVDLQGYVTFSNISWAEMHGYTVQELTGKHLSIFHTEEQLAHEVNPFNELVFQNGFHRGEVGHRHKNGTTFPTIMTSSMIRNESGEPIGIMGMARDITELKQAQQALQESEEKYRSLFSSSALAIGLRSLDGSYIEFNDAYSRMLGYSNEELQNLKTFDLTHPDDRHISQSNMQAIAAGDGEVRRYEKRYLHKNGGIVWGDVSIQPLKSADGNITAILGTVVDITERKKAEDAVRKSGERLASIFRAAPVGIGMVVNRVLTAGNARLCEMVGYTWEELANQSARILYPTDEDYEYVGQEKYRQIAEGGSGTVETCWRNKNGTIIHVLLSSAPIDPTDLSRGVTFTALDITERKHAEQALAHSSDLMRYIIEHNRSAVAVHDRDLRYIYVSQRYLDEYSIKERDVIGKHHYEIFPDLPQKWRDVHQRALKGEVLSAEDDPYIRADGTVDWTRWECRPWYEADGSIGGIIVYTEVITERKRAEQALLESEERYRQIVEASPLGIHTYELDINNRLVFTGSNPAADKILGIDNARYIGLTIEEAFPPLATTDVPFYYRRAACEGIPWKTEEIQYEHGQLKGIYQVYAFQTGKNRATVMFQDVTERKLSEEALRESEERLRQIIEQMPYPVEICDPNGIAKMVNRAFLQMFDIPSAEPVIDKYNVFEDQLTMEVLGLGSDIKRVYTGEAVFIPELTIPLDRVSPEHGVRRSGDLTLEATMFPVFRGAGQIWRVVTIWKDITERKQAEQALLEQTDELETLFNVSSALRSAKSTDEMLPVVLKEMRHILKADAGAVILLDSDKSNFTITLSDGILAANTGRRFAATEGMSAKVVNTRKPLVIDDINTTPDRLPGILGEENIGPEAIVPLMSETEILGVFLAERVKDSPKFSEGEIRLLSAIGEMIGNTLRRTRLYDQALNRQEQLQATHNIDLAITSSIDLRVTLDVLLSEVTSHLKVDAADVLLFNPQTYLLEYISGRGLSTKGVERVRLGEGIAGRIASERQSMGLCNITDSKNQFTNRRALDGKNFTAYYGAPMVSKGQVIGVLEVFHGAAIHTGTEWLEFLESAATQAAIAIDNAHMFDGLQRANFDLSLAYDATIEGWSRALDLRDKETEGHSRRVTEMSIHLARELNINEEKLVHIRRGALLHDIGKMGISDSILLKPGPLTDEEWVEMRKHPEYAYDLLYPISYLRPALDIPLYHHERWDGSGYPRGLQGEKIPLAARIFSVVDVWDAITSHRPYRAAWPQEKAQQYIQEQAGKEFDPQVVNVFLRKLHSFTTTYPR